jgi:hypothetical protein
MLDKVFDFLMSRWDFISANPAICCALLFVGAVAGYLGARWHYDGVRKQIDFLKDKISHLEKTVPAKAHASAPDNSVNSVPSTIPLVDAARKAFDATRDTPVAEIALKSDAGVLLQCCTGTRQRWRNGSPSTGLGPMLSSLARLNCEVHGILW